MMVDIAALMRALPASGLESNYLALIDGFGDSSTSIVLLEPPASGIHVPYINPLRALEELLFSQGITRLDAKNRAIEYVVQLKNNLPVSCWVNFFDSIEPESPKCMPAPDFIAWLREENKKLLQTSQKFLVQNELIDFIEKAANVATTDIIFMEPSSRALKWSLETLPKLTPPEAMIEFMPGAPWGQDDWDENRNNPIFFAWRDAIRPLAEKLEQILGEPVYYFADLNYEFDDDYVHRFLVLHWCCTYKPESAYVKYLLKASGAVNVEELKNELINPASFTQPFKMIHSGAIEARFCRMHYISS